MCEKRKEELGMKKIECVEHLLLMVKFTVGEEGLLSRPRRAWRLLSLRWS
jgi:hypothetical protein